ncbi:GIY-YIG nuclease family protein [Methylosinus sp. Sm6]|uniref:GIY-YIG nuclease family protein n=1 Tax=Methylosinus sp. Sm6 TaxID=2866948 RepID=UPI001C9A2639|nr:GIY-YIG nuclease family protein [Methylosinus sp. Sm6]MBY6243705.1 GIY-YIG nuclease family protein [Methylosinus sp. Sm6]
MNRKSELKRTYKETPKKMGVYRVVNRQSGQSLLECGRDVDARLNRHMTELRFGSHRNRALQDDWNRLGADAFAFEIVELLKPLDDKDYDPASDLEALLQLTQEGEEFAPAKLYNPTNR